MTGADPLRVGLLAVDVIDEPHRGIAGDYPELFERLLARHGVDLVGFDGRSEVLPDAAACDGWIVPGSRQSVFDDLEWLPRLTAWIGAAIDDGVPLVGVCFGHQLIARALGAPVARSELGWSLGAVDYSVVAPPPGVVTSRRSFRILACHQDQVQELPAGADLLARAAGCPIAAYSFGERVLCLQGHPEFVPGQARSIYAARAERVGRDRFDAALTSLDRRLDSDLVGRWITTSMRHAAGLPRRSPAAPARRRAIR